MRASLTFGFLACFGFLASTAVEADAERPLRELSDGPMGMFIPRAGATNYGDGRTEVTKGGGGLSASLQIQPLVHTDHGLRNAYIEIHSAASIGDFADSSHKGIEVGAQVVSWERDQRLFRLSLAAGISLDAWDVFDDNDRLPNGTATSVGLAARPAMRLWRLELSMPFKIGRTIGSSDSSSDLDGRSFRFWGLEVGLLIY